MHFPLAFKLSFEEKVTIKIKQIVPLDHLPPRQLPPRAPRLPRARVQQLPKAPRTVTIFRREDPFGMEKQAASLGGPIIRQ